MVSRAAILERCTRSEKKKKKKKKQKNRFQQAMLNASSMMATRPTRSCYFWSNKSHKPIKKKKGVLWYLWEQCSIVSSFNFKFLFVSHTLILLVYSQSVFLVSYLCILNFRFYTRIVRASTAYGADALLVSPSSSNYGLGDTLLLSPRAVIELACSDYNRWQQAHYNRWEIV